ncbi:MAG TPA: hypothetical protein VF370_00735 [Candidatus Cryosericum sp.]
MTSITVRLHASLKKYAKSRGGTASLNIPDETTVLGVARILSIGPMEAGLFVLNGELVHDNVADSTMVHDKDVLDVYSMMFGG